jgi:outer membrane protein OmpA-like peptidoglycan-associated protein
MKKLSTTALFFLSIGVFAFGSPKEHAAAKKEDIRITVNSTNSTYKEFEKEAKNNRIAHRKLTNLKGVKNGYYVISGVYGSTPNAKQFVNKLRGKGFAPNYFQVAETGMNYVYLKYFKKGPEAVKACASRFNNLYKDEVWIMAVENEPAARFVSSSKAKSVKKSSSSSKKESFKEAAEKNNIVYRTVSNLRTASNGYYAISGVYGNELNAKKLVRKLKVRGFAADYIQVAETGLNYVYLKSFKNGREAVLACASRFNNLYKEKVWIMEVENKPAPKVVSSTRAKSITKPTLKNNRATFEKAADKNKIVYRTVFDLKTVTNGYYVISGVYGSEFNAKKFVNRLKGKGFAADYIRVVETGMNYVYLDYFENGQEAISVCATRFNNSYKADVWIMVARNEAESKQDSFALEQLGQIANKTGPSFNKPLNYKEETFEEAADKNNITYRTFSNMVDTANGYYVISGTFSSSKNSDKSIKKLKKKGFDPGSVMNPMNGLNYVYLQYYKDWKKAIEVCKTHFDGEYDDEIWVLKADNGESDTAKTYLSGGDDTFSSDNTLNESRIGEDIKNAKAYNALDYEEPSPTFSLKETSNKNKLIKKADQYFNKMWYAEAAELYEQALLKGDKYYTREIIQKVADAHYYNTNMQKAYEWYHILYENYGKELSADNLFKYAHSLKGTGKYARSKRLMRLYDRKAKNGAIRSSNFDNGAMPSEMVLDNILASKEDFNIKNLAINTKYSDFSPMFYDSTKVVFASAMDSSFFNTRRYKWNDQPYLDLYVAKVNEGSDDLRDATKFSKKINTKYHEASVTFSPDNKTMYFTRNNYGKKLKRDKNGVNHLKIYMSQKVGDEWADAIELPFNSDKYSTGHPALSPDGKQLYFVSDMPGSIGGTDIFVVDVLDTNNFSEPRNLGPYVNTDRREMFPFFNGKKLYFSSDGHTGLGGLDVFQAVYTEEGGFERAENVGQPVNSNKDDFSYIVDEESHKGYFASNRKGGKGDDDIYSFEQIIEEPENLNAIAGVVTELVTGEIIPQALVMLLDENNIKLMEVVTGDDGSFMFEDLDSNTKYTIKTQKGEHFDVETEVSTGDNELVRSDVTMERLDELIAIEDGVKKVKTEMIHFDFDKSYIRNDASIELDKLVAVMNEYPGMVIKIESHTDSRGTRAYNEYLSDKRAKSTREYLIDSGIAPERIESAIGYGEERLLNECNGKVRCTEAAHFLNRRSEFIILNM